jgi:hypothetical protein
VKVTIDANGRKVEVECVDANTTTREVLNDALDTWKATDGTPDSQGPAYGFTAAHAGYQQSPMNGARIREVKA